VLKLIANHQVVDVHAIKKWALQWLVYILEDVECKTLVVPYHVRNIGVFSLLKRTKCSASTTCPVYTQKNPCNAYEEK
jgi:hypothetical protein